MKNRAKCKLCNTIIESFHDQDIVYCDCGCIMLYGGASMKCAADNWDNFVRVDDKGNEIIVSVIDKTKAAFDMPLSKPDYDELLKMLNEMIKNIETLPSHAATAPITHYDFASALLLVHSIFRALDDS